MIAPLKSVSRWNFLWAGAAGGGEAPSSPSTAAPEGESASAATEEADPGVGEASDSGEPTAADAAGEDDLPEYEPLTPELVEDDAMRNDFMLRLVVVLLAFLLACTEISDTRTLVHVKTGQYIAENGWLPPRTDVFSYTASDRPWLNLGWLFDLFSAGVYGLGGAIGLSLAKAGLAAVAFYLVIQAGRSQVSSWWGSICAALALLAAVPQFTMQPELVTLLGIALVLWILRRWQSDADANAPWLLVPVVLLWSNLDPRAFLGLALLVLFALGETIGAWFGRSSLLSATRRKSLWIVLGACFLAALVNPFGWHSLTAPLALYGGEYAGWRALIGPDPEMLPIGLLQSYPMTSGVFWKSLNIHTVAGLVLMAAAAVTFVLNRRHVPLSHVLVFLGFLGFALAGTHELAAAGIVWAVLATINAQQWYRENFRQTYSIDLGERLFSTGGRAVTALALFAVAYLAVSGRLMGPHAPRTGVGWDQPLQAAITGLREDLATVGPDQRGFNFLLVQGDLMIWLDRKVFADERLALYTRSGEKNLIDLHLRVRDALQSSDPSPISRDRELWRQTFDEFGITHALPYLGSARPNYQSYFRMLFSADGWDLTHLGPTAAVFAPRKVESEAAPREPRVDFPELAFRTTSEEIPTRADWARPASWYETTLFLPEETRLNDVQLARHYSAYLQLYLQNAAGPELVRMGPNGAALAALAIRKTNQGLADDPQNALAYRVLGDACAFLEALEGQQSALTGQSPWWKRRFVQAVNAYRQSLIIHPGDPDNNSTRQALRNLYFTHGFYDLALELARDYADHAPDIDSLTAQQLRELEENQMVIEQLSAQVTAVEEEIQKQLEENEPNYLAAAQFARNQGCVRLALQQLGLLRDEELQPLERAHMQLFRSVLLLEAGEAEQASLELGQLEGITEQFGDQFGSLRWRPHAALAALANGQYTRAIELWTDELRDYERGGVLALVETLPMASQPVDLTGAGGSETWAVNRALAATGAANAQETAADALLNLAICHLEMGQPERAKTSLDRLLELSPETSLRPVAASYLSYLKDEAVDLLPPSAWIPVTQDMFAPESEQDQ